MYGGQRVRGCGFRGRVWFICVRRSAVAIEMLNIELNIGINVEIKVE